MGKINRIQLRGISRTPSDRMTDDGGVSESLNVYLDHSESAPVICPNDITADLRIPENNTIERVYIHKTLGLENYIVSRKSDSTTEVGLYKENQFESIVTLQSDEVISNISSVGNTVMVSTNNNTHYFIFIEGEYEYKGTQIPIPQMDFIGTEKDRMTTVALYPNRDSAIARLDRKSWNDAINDRQKGKQNVNIAEIEELEEEFWNAINRANTSGGGIDRLFLGPVLVRSAVRLYDGSYIYQSVPVLIGSGYEKTVNATASSIFTPAADDNTELYSTSIDAELKAYSIKAILKKWDLTGWEDIIESVDIFVSTTISYPFQGTRFSLLTNHTWDELSSKDTITFEASEETEYQGIEGSILSKGNFYKVKSFGVNALSKLEKGYDFFDGESFPTQDDLVTRDRLPDYEQSFSTIVPSKVIVVNNRVLAISENILLPTGHGFLNSVSGKGQVTSEKPYAMCFFVQAKDGKMHKVVSKYYDGTELFYPNKAAEYYEYPYGMIFYPDARCKEARVWIDGSVYSIDMKSHPLLNCSYGYWGADKMITDLTPIQTDVNLNTFVADESRKIGDFNKLYQSEMANPFYFPLEGNFSFNARVLGMEAANTPLSEGQFGQYPLYVFTEDGIWAMETASDGSFISSKPLSREVCSNPDSITPIDQAVVFVSDKGLMLLQGSQITELSPFMNGKHYVINDSAKQIIKGQPGYDGMIETLSDPSSFMAFMKHATIGYDYQGKRLICINETQDHQYVYKLDTQTWHRTLHADKGRMIAPLNSYPRCEVMAQTADGTKIIDLSTSLDGTKIQRPEKGVIATRPFDLQEPDVLKTITDVRVRGQFGKGAVKFILQGSHDNINWYTISTLRGKSWKLFRLIILADLEPTDRISWVDVQYETRFTNKLR